MTTNRRRFVLGAAALPMLTIPAFAKGRYDEGASDTEILIGNTSPHSGPASSYGVIANAISAYWDMVNERGGITGDA